MLRTIRVLVAIALPAIACAQQPAQPHEKMSCCDHMDKAASCGKGGLSKDEIKTRLAQLKHELKLSDAKIDKIAEAIAAAAPAHECCDQHKDGAKMNCCE